jgi:hypothetical protein
MTIIYFDVDARVSEPVNNAQATNLKEFLPGKKAGDLGDSPLNPVLWER